MPVKIFVGRLSEGTHKDDLLALFSKYGEVVECDVLTNFGFVHMGSIEEANAAIAALDGFNLKGSNIHVELSTAKTQGRKKRIDGRVLGMDRVGMGPSPRYDPYAHHPHRVPEYPPQAVRGPPVIEPPPAFPPQREEYASEQVKDLLELYIRDPVAFDQYAKTYYYGERMERINRENSQPKAESVMDSYYQPVRRF